jgi:hypothetical protein
MAEGYAGLRAVFLKGVEVDDHHIDGLDAVGGDGGFVLLVAANVEQAAVDLGVQGLDAAVEHLGKAGQVADVLDGQAGLAQRARRSAGGDQFDAKAASAWANSTRPVLSVTLSNAAESLFRTHSHALLVLGRRIVAGFSPLSGPNTQTPDYNEGWGMDFWPIRAWNAARALQSWGFMSHSAFFEML